MRNRLIIALATGALALVPAAAQANGAPVAHSSCARATILGQSKCIARGPYCTHTARAERDYRRHGLSCSKRDRNGRYHLQ